MIVESRFWKGPLVRVARRLKKLKNVADPSERQLVQLERDLLVGCYAVRKLFETPMKVTDSTRKSVLTVSWYPNAGKPVTWRNNHRVDELYDFSHENTESRDIGFICNKIIHSFILAPIVDECGLNSVAFTSDRDKDARLFVLRVDQIIEVFERVGNDNPKGILVIKDPQTNEENIRVE